MTIRIFSETRAKVQNYYVYIMSNKPHGVLYTGITNDLIRRVWQHKTQYIEGFTSRYKLFKLMHYEHFENKWDAVNRERMLKNWKRQWKIELIEKDNPKWIDLYPVLVSDPDLRQDAIKDDAHYQIGPDLRQGSAENELHPDDNQDLKTQENH